MTGSQPHSRPVLTEDLWQILFIQAFLFATKYIHRLRWRGTFGGVLPDGDDAESIAAQAVTDFLLSHPACRIRHHPFIPQSKNPSIHQVLLAQQSNNPLIQQSTTPLLPRSI